MTMMTVTVRMMTMRKVCGVGSFPPGCGGRCVVWVVVLLVVEEGVWCG